MDSREEHGVCRQRIWKRLGVFVGAVIVAVGVAQAALAQAALAAEQACSLATARKAVQWIERRATPPSIDDMKALASQLQVGFVSVTGPDGVVKLTSDPKHLGYGLLNDTQSMWFLQLLDTPGLELEQPPLPSVLNPKKLVSVSAVGGGVRGGFTQVGCYTPAPVADTAPRAVVAGSLAYMPSEDDDFRRAAVKRLQGTLPGEVLPVRQQSFSSNTALLLALQHKKIDFITRLPLSTAKYMVARNTNFVLAEGGIPIDFMMAVRPENERLCRRLNTVIAELKHDGSLARLTAAWITGESRLAAQALPTMANVPTITVGVTGDLPPMDYTDASDAPTGFNVALLSLISKRLQLNIRLVNIHTAARLPALAAKKIDVMFWVTGFGNNTSYPAVRVTEPYFSDTTAQVGRNDTAELMQTYFDTPKR